MTVNKPCLYSVGPKRDSDDLSPRNVKETFLPVRAVGNQETRVGIFAAAVPFAAHAFQTVVSYYYLVARTKDLRDMGPSSNAVELKGNFISLIHGGSANRPPVRCEFP